MINDWYDVPCCRTAIEDGDYERYGLHHMIASKYTYLPVRSDSEHKFAEILGAVLIIIIELVDSITRDGQVTPYM